MNGRYISSLVYLLFLSFFSFVYSYDTFHEVVNLPGFPGRLQSKIYTGYIRVGTDFSRHIFYWFVESFRSPSDDPLILWLQGGPGASGAIGLFSEFGPFTLSDESFNLMDINGVLRPYENLYTFSKFANIIFIEAPSAVGFSYCNGNCPVFNDTSTASDNLDFVKGFLSLFKRFSQNDFFIAGESYGGVYVPMLAELVLKEESINFKGVMVGNGCTGFTSDGGCGRDENYWLVDFLHGHYQISTELYKQLITNCLSFLIDKYQDTSSECKVLMRRLNLESGPFYQYGLYDKCFGENDLYFFSNKKSGIRTQYDDNDYTCGKDRALNAYLNHKLVQSVFHAFGKWEMHDGNWDLYEMTKDDVKYIYNMLVENGKRVLIYYGDTDTAVPYNGGENWIENLGLKAETSFLPLIPDSKTGIIIGHYKHYEKGLTFATIRGAEHMVPGTKPKASFSLMKWFLFGNEDAMSNIDTEAFEAEELKKIQAEINDNKQKIDKLKNLIINLKNKK